MVSSRMIKSIVVVLLGFGISTALSDTATAKPRRTAPRVVVKPKHVAPVKRVAVKPEFSFRLTLPGAVTLSLGGAKYYRHGNLHYRRVFHDGRWVYVVVPSPPGTYVAKLPDSPERVVINGQTYYRANGTFYADAASQPSYSAGTPALESPPAKYVITKPPVGAIVDVLPVGHEQVGAKHANYFRSDDTYFLKIAVANKTKYVIVEKPQ